MADRLKLIASNTDELESILKNVYLLTLGSTDYRITTKRGHLMAEPVEQILPTLDTSEILSRLVEGVECLYTLFAYKKVFFFEDSGHGWAKVLRKDLVNLGLEYSTTRYSYQRAEYVFLEEDLDFPNYINAQFTRGIKIEMEETFVEGHSEIRKYDPYQPTPLVNEVQS